MTMAQRNNVNFTSNNFEKTPQSVDEPRAYERILVFLDGDRMTERVLPTAIGLARAHNASLVLVCRNHTCGADYLDRKCRDLQSQGVTVNGYLVASEIKSLPAWIVKSEKADAVVISQKAVGWFERWLGGDAAAKLRASTNADVITVDA